MRQRKSPLFSFLGPLLALLVLPLSAHVVEAQAVQTVMVSVSAQEAFDPYLLSAVEAGVMDVFFEAGIIVFNAGTYERVGESDRERHDWVRRTARKGGATHTVEVDVELTGRPGEPFRIGGATFRLVRLETASIVAGGRVAASEVTAPAESPADQIGFRIGTTIGRSALSRM